MPNACSLQVSNTASISPLSLKYNSSLTAAFQLQTAVSVVFSKVAKDPIATRPYLKWGETRRYAQNFSASKHYQIDHFVP